MDIGNQRTTLVVIFGGQSAEHDVSCVTAAHIIRAASHETYRTKVVGISRDGQWFMPSLDELPNGGIDPERIGERLVAQGTPISPQFLFDPAQHHNTVVFPVIHGPLGEDGTLQGLLELAGLPFVGSGVLSCSVAMDKAMAKTVFAQFDIPQVNYIVLREDQVTSSKLEEVGAQLGYPLFVKPANMGSSVGVSKVFQLDELEHATTTALQYDQWVLFEEAIVGRELEVAVMGNRTPQTSVVGEIIPGDTFYNYSDKYESNSASLRIPAPLSPDDTAKIQQLALRAYDALRCEGLARVDFFFEEHGRGFLLNEINTIPGFTPISMYPKLWNATGVSYPELIDNLVGYARERHRQQKRFTSR